MCPANRMGALAGAALFMFCALGVFAQAPSQRLQWTAVEGARGYAVEIRERGGAELRRDTTETPELEVALPPGSYEVRITALNVFMRPLTVGEWTPLTVRVTAEIQVASVFAPGFYSGAAEGTLSITGSGFLEETRARLELGTLRIEAEKKEASSGNRLVLRFPLAGAEPGTYDLILENPGGRSARAAGAVTVLVRTAPFLESMEPAEAGNDRAYPRVVLRGRGLGQETRVVFRGPGGVEVLPSRILSAAEDELALALNLAERPAGSYDVLLENPGGLRHEAAGALTLRDALAGETVAAAAPAEPSPPPPEPAAEAPPPAAAPQSAAEAAVAPPETAAPATAAATPIAAGAARGKRALVSLGWRAGFYFDEDFSALYDPSFLGGELSLAVPFRQLFAAIPLVRSLSLELRTDFGLHPGAAGENVEASALMLLDLATGLAWTVRAAGPFGLALRGGYGLAFTRAERESPLGSSSAASQDTMLFAGASLRWDAQRWLAEAGADWQGTYYVGETAHQVRPYLRLGLWLD